MATPLEELNTGDRIRILGGKNFEKFHGGMEGTVTENRPDCKNMSVQFDDVATAGPTPISVAYRHLEAAPTKGSYRAGAATAAASSNQGAGSASQEAPKGPMLDEHGPWKAQQLVQLHGLQGAQELNGKLGRLRRFDPTAQRWEVDVRDAGAKRLKEDNLQLLPKAEVPAGLGVAELKSRGNECFKRQELEQAVACYSVAIDLLDKEDGATSAAGSKAGPAGEGGPASPAEAAGQQAEPETEGPKYLSVLYGNRAQCYITLCREVHGEEKAIGKEARGYAMRANMDSSRAIELDPTNGKAYYRRGCAVLGMAPSASRSKEAIYSLELALTGRASGGQDGVVLPNAMRHEVSSLLDYAKRRLDACTEAAVPDVEQCRENCRQQ